jgi:hypothetical protein
MAMQKRFSVNHGDVFPQGAFLKGSVEQVIDFDKSSKDSRVQAVDLNARGEGTGLPLWQVMVLDADEEAGKKDTAVTVKIAAKHQPVPPENKTQFPWTPVAFTGLTALPYIEESAQGRSRIVWSFRAEGMVAPGSASGAGSAPAKGAA